MISTRCLRPVHGLREPDRQLGHAERMTGRGRVARLDRGDGGLHEPLEQGLDALVEPAVLERDRRLGRQRDGEVGVPGAERLNLPLDLPRGREPALQVRLAVDELEDADDLFLLRLHRDDEHRLRPVADLRVKCPVDLEGRAGRRMVGVRQVDDLARERDVARHALSVDWDRELLEGHVHTVVLREREAQAPIASVALLHEIERARVAVGDLAGLGQNELEEPLQVPLRREADPDAIQVAELDGEAVEVAPRRHVLEGVVQDPCEHGRGGVPWKTRVPLRGDRLGRRARRQERDQGQLLGPAGEAGGPPEVAEGTFDEEHGRTVDRDGIAGAQRNQIKLPG